MPAKDVKNDCSVVWDQFRNGDQFAYTQLMNTYSAPLFNYGYRICQDKDFVKDCIQEVFLELWKRRERINPTGSVKWYLFKAVRLRIFREQPKWAKKEPVNDDYHFTVEFNIESKIIHDLMDRELAVKVQTVLNQLPPRQKEIIYLRFYENLDFDQISNIMHISRQSVHNLLQKAYKSFRMEWAVIVVLLLAQK